ncbi:MAG: hypothetical protein ABJ375_13225 [Rhizobiaceae bacterium]
MTEEELKKELEIMARAHKAKRQREAQERAAKATKELRARYGLKGLKASG